MMPLGDLENPDDIAALVLPDPKSLTAAELRALRLALRFRLIECRGGFRAGDAKVSRATAAALEKRCLAVRLLSRCRYELVCTGAGKQLLDLTERSRTSTRTSTRKGPRR